MKPLNRRQWLALTSVGSVLALSGQKLVAAGPAPSASFGDEVVSLLADWCDALLRLQSHDAANAEEFGGFRCPACGFVHGRCADAAYPLLTLAARSGKSEYVEAAQRVVAWSANVDTPDGAWKNDPGKLNGWKGITVFGSIALAESLRHHAKLLDPALVSAWTDRLRRAVAYLFERDLWNDHFNVNYPITASYAYTICGQVLDNPQYTQRGREYARRSLEFLTARNRLIFGECQPLAKRSPKGLLAVDLGYNVEESLPALVQYALLTGDDEVLGPVVESLQSHLEFMLPDGGWDNSWGVRNYKWTYWGSRTSDGCLPAYALLADRDPRFVAAAVKHLALLRASTQEGLLQGGPHCTARQIPPCVHHTFCHAKALASLVDHPRFKPDLVATAPLPRAVASGIRSFPELQVSLAAAGSWRGTVTGYDWFTADERATVYQATGGALSLLWHEEVGLVLCASLATYIMWEPHNMHPNTWGEDVPLTPRVEQTVGEERVSNLRDSSATFTSAEEAGELVFRVKGHLGSETSPCEMTYRFTPGCIRIETKSAQGRLVLPIIATAATRAAQPDKRTITIGKVQVTAATRLQAPGGLDKRIFNPVPGLEALSLVIEPDQEGRCLAEIRVG